MGVIRLQYYETRLRDISVLILKCARGPSARKEKKCFIWQFFVSSEVGAHLDRSRLRVAFLQGGDVTDGYVTKLSQPGYYESIFKFQSVRANTRLIS